MPRAFAFALLALSVPLSGSKVVELRLLARSARYVPFFDKFVLHLLPPWPVPGHFYPLFSGDCRQLSRRQSLRCTGGGVWPLRVTRGERACCPLHHSRFLHSITSLAGQSCLATWRANCQTAPMMKEDHLPPDPFLTPLEPLLMGFAFSPQHLADVEALPSSASGR